MFIGPSSDLNKVRARHPILSPAPIGMRSRASRRRLSDNDIGCSASDRRWFPARPAQHVHRRRNNGRGRIPSALASAHGRNGKKPLSRHTAPDAPERIDHRRRCTRDAHRTCCRGSRGARPYRGTPCENASNGPRRIAPTAHFERNDVTMICETVHQGFFAEMESKRPHSGSNPRVLCLTNVYFGQQWHRRFA